MMKISKEEQSAIDFVDYVSRSIVDLQKKTDSFLLKMREYNSIRLIERVHDSLIRSAEDVRRSKL